MTRQILSWISVVQPQTGNVLVVRVPDDVYVAPGTPDEQVTDEQKAVYEQIRVIFKTLVEGLQANGIQPAGGVVITEKMTLEDVAPPPRPGQEMRRPSGLVLPPGTRVR